MNLLNADLHCHSVVSDGQPQVARGGGGARLAVDLVMIGQRPQLHAIGLGTFGQGFGLQGATT